MSSKGNGEGSIYYNKQRKSGTLNIKNMILKQVNEI